MRTTLAGGVLLAFLVIPYAFRRSLESNGSARWFGWFGMVTLFGVSGSLVALFGALVAPGPLPLTDLPRAVDICLTRAKEILAHPFHHWTSIAAAIVLVALLARIVVAVVLTSRDARRARPPIAEFAGEREAAGLYLGAASKGVRVLPIAEPIAYTTGLLRPETVVSTGLLGALEDSERMAVISHERAHAGRGHVLALFAARVIERAFGFIPSIALSVRYVVRALEVVADEAAVDRVGDRLVVARAIAITARLQALGPRVVPGLAGEDVAYRIRRLLNAPPEGRSRPLLLAMVLLTSATLLLQGVAWSAGAAALSREQVSHSLHGTCDISHAGRSDV